MYRIGIFGSENSHAMAFAKLFGHDPELMDARVVAIGGESAEDCVRIHDECGVELIAGAPRDMIGAIDAAMVTSRNGALHLRYARPFIEAGLPTFVDKPIANDSAEAVTLIKIAQDRNVPLMGGSSLKYEAGVQSLKALRHDSDAEVTGGVLWAPLSMHNEYGGFYFYSAHLAEMCLEIFGMEPLSVDAFERCGNVTAVVHYKTFDVCLQFMDGVYHYGGLIQTKSGPLTRPIEVSDGYRLEALAFARMLRTGQMPRSHREMVRSVFLLNAIEASYTRGCRQMIGDLEPY